MAKNKTTQTPVDVFDFINTFVDKEEKKQDSYRLIELMQTWSGHEPKMWGPSIIGFGQFRYQYTSGHGGEMPLMGFSPRKTAITLYVTDPTRDNQKLLDQMGSFTMGKSCIYVKRLSDIDLKVLEKLAKENAKYALKKYKQYN